MAVIDLSALPAPTIIEPLDYEAILAALVADFTARYPEFSALVESEPVLKLLEVAAYRELLVRWRINEAAKQNMIPFASGSNLDHLVAIAGVGRAAGESDARLLDRYLLALEAFSVAGPAGAYRYHALSADPTVKNAIVSSPTPGNVRIVVVGGANADGLPSAALVAKVSAAVAADRDVRPLTDTVEVLGARNICYQVALTIHVAQGPDASIVKAAAEAAILDYLLAQHDAGAAVDGSRIIAAATVPGVERVSGLGLAYAPGAAHVGDAIDVATLAGIPSEWRAASALWPCLPASVTGGAPVVLAGSIQGYRPPATAPADGLTVTVA